MLVEISVENLAIIEQLQVALGPGFTVLTGETGAGKSLLVDAIELALGERADADLVRSGASRSVVSVVMDLSDQPALKIKCAELGIPLEEDLLYIQRELFAEGRSQCRISGKLTPVAGLKQLGQLLVDLHGQHAHQSLLQPDRHLDFLDAWVGQPAQSLADRVAANLDEVLGFQRRLSTIRNGRRDREQKKDLLNYQVNEIESANPQMGEFEFLENKLSRLKNAEKLSLAANAALQKLKDAESSAYDAIGDAIRATEEAARMDDSLTTALEPLRNAYYSLDDGIRLLRTYADQIQSEPALLEETAARIDTLKRLFRKYGDDEMSVIAFLHTAQLDLGLLESADESEEEIATLLQYAEAKLKQSADELTAIRKEKAAEFAAVVERELRDLAMDKAVFQVSVEPKAVDSTGGDRVEFSFSANTGEIPRPLAKIASGGEISRAMLAIKTALAGKAGVPTLIFDEIDAGLGGRAAAVVAKKLEELAAHYQVVVISHLPQIAGRASAHYNIEKSDINGRVRTSVRALHGEERVDEIGRMMSSGAITETARAAARELIS